MTVSSFHASRHAVRDGVVVFLFLVLGLSSLLSAGDAVPDQAPASTPAPAPAGEADEVHHSAVGEIAEVVSALSGGTVATAGTTAPESTPASREQARYLEERERERQSQLAEAEDLARSADQRIMESLPYPLNILLGVSFFGITLWRYLAAAAVIALGIVVFILLRRHFRAIERRLKTDTSRKDWRFLREVLFLALRSSARLFVLALVLRAVSSFIVTKYHPDVIWLSNMLLYFVVIMYLYDLVGLVDTYYGDRLFKRDNRLIGTLRPILRKAARVLILVIAGLHIYNDLTGQTAVSVLAGLGIGGIALALASQETLKNLLGFASIAMDKTFYVGDAVNINNIEGTVEHVGIRSLRLRSYEGRAVVIPNSTAMAANVVNLNRAPYMRREMLLRIHPGNPGPKIEEALSIMREVLETHDGKLPGMPPVVRFSEYEPARLVLQGMFWYDADKPFFFDECSRINLEVAKRFYEAGIVFAER